MEDSPDMLTTLPASMAESSDLFEGELFGEELLDIYDATVGEGEPVGSLPSLPTSLPFLVYPEDKSTTDDSHPGREVEVDAASDPILDDGLGSFRPSTSFNDLAGLVSSSPPQDSSMAKPLPVVSNEGDLPIPSSSGRKRGSGNLQGPPSKKRSVGNKRSSSTSAKSKKNTSKDSKTSIAPATTSVPDVVVSKPFQTAAPINHPKANERATQKVAVVSPQLSSKNVLAPDIVASAQKAIPEARLSSAAPTKSDFQSVAQAAVSNLIMTAATSTKVPESSLSKDSGSDDGSNSKVDISTAHIRTLTSNNWVAACGGQGASADANESKGNNRTRKQNLSPEERARQNRDRNREHARNTRLRKKAYVEELKKTLTELVAQRDANELSARQAAQREAEQREVRFRVVKEFLKLCGENELAPVRWAAILTDEFVLTHPKMASLHRSPYSLSEQSPVHDVKCVGVAEVMKDSQEMAAFLQTLRDKYNHTQAIAPVRIHYNCCRDQFLMDGNTTVLDWTAVTVGATSEPSQQELSFGGTLRATFCPASNKLVNLSFVFDTATVLVQARRLVEKHQDDIILGLSSDASSDAGMILDSLEMPHVTATSSPLGDNYTAVSDDKGESSDDSVVSHHHLASSTS